VTRAALLLLLLLAGPAWAVQPDEQLKDPALEARAREISSGLRCLVCQNESIDESHAPLARDLRLLVRQRIESGDTDEQIRDFLVARYGDYVLLKPRFGPGTALLWLTPLLALGGGAIIALRRFRTAGPAAAERLSAEEEKDLARILDDR
jgi:cytochrome c-type biogenesis protein CcmH